MATAGGGGRRAVHHPDSTGERGRLVDATTMPKRLHGTEMPKVVASEAVQPDEALLISGPLVIRDAPAALMPIFIRCANVRVEGTSIAFADSDAAAYLMAVAVGFGIITEQESDQLLADAARELAESGRAVKMKGV
jgi:hypothetical protein